MSSFKENFVKARVQLIRKSPFFGTLLLNTNYRVVDFVPTAATDGECLLINEEYMANLPFEQFKSVLLHEVLHMALEHVARLKDVFMSDPQVANIAADIVVNGIIDDNRFPLPEGAVRDNSLKHLSAREIYNILKQEKQKDEEAFAEKYGVGDGVNECLQSVGQGQGQGQGQGEGGEESANGASGTEGSGTSKPNWKDILNKAATIARSKNHGMLGAGLKRVFAELLEPTIDWRDALYKYITAAETDFENYDRRFVHQGDYFDALGGGKINLLVFVDTSGSVDMELLTQFVSELRFAVNALPQTTGRLWYFDTQLYDQGDVMEIFDTPKVQGGGGTSFRPIMDKLAKAHDEDLCAKTLGVVFTDGYADLHQLDEPPCSVMWCISPGGVGSEFLPFGEVVRIMR